MNCPEELTLWELVQGSLSADELARVDTHLDSCPECRDVVGVLASAERVRAPAGKQRGDTLGRFTLDEAIGEGAMGAVFLARDPQLSRDVALKVLHPETATERGQARLLREARAMAQLSHPHVIRVYEAGQQDETVYLVMEPAAENLREWLARHPSQADILRVFGEAAMGLQAAHEAGVIHRDFKPENVLLSRQGVAQVADFGLAADAPRLPDAEPDTPAGSRASERDLSRPPLAPLAQASLTRTGALLGTPAYMAPERLSGAPATPLSDQFSFCVSLWEALEGARPFQATSLFELLESMQAGPPPAAAMPRHVEGALRRGMRPAPGQRYPTMTALITALQTSARQRRRGRVALALSAAGLVLLGGGVALRAGFALTQDADPCSQDGRIRRVWNADARTRLMRPS